MRELNMNHPIANRRLPRAARLASLLFVILLFLRLITTSSAQDADQLHVLAPATGASFVPGDQLTMRWSYMSSAQPFPVMAYLTRTDTGAHERYEMGWNIQPDSGATTTFDWFIPNTLPAGQYVATVANFNASIQHSSGVFSIGALPQPTQIRILYPPSSAGWPLSAFAAGSQLTIQWDYPIGHAAPVDIYLDIFANTTLHTSLLLAAGLPPTPTAGTLQYTWTIALPGNQVPQNAHYKIRAVSASGAMGSSADFFTITGLIVQPTSVATSIPTSTPNLLQNGSFEAGTADSSPHWVFTMRPGAIASFTRDSTIYRDGAAAARIDITQSNPIDWYVQMSQGGLPTLNGKSYLISFWARASTPRPISVVIQRDSAPWSEYFYSEVNLTTEWKLYKFPYISTLNDDQAALRLNFAQATGQIWIDDIVYVETAAAPLPDPIDPQPTSTPLPIPSSTPLPTGQNGNWNMLFRDEFSSTALDQSKWVRCYLYVWDNVGCYKTSGTSSSWYMPDDVLVDDGLLKLRAQQRTVTGSDGNSYAYTSGIISSGKDTYDPTVAPRFAFQYGYVEIRAKIPAGQGFWSAFWMLQANGQWPWEIDILESLGNQPNSAYFNVHYPTPNWDDAANPSHYSGPDFSADFHTYAVEWAPDKIVWYIDGVERKRVTDPSQIPHAPMYLMANLQVGGDWPGPPDATTPLPAYLELDYIRVWQQGN